MNISYVTYVTTDFVPGAVALWKSLRRFTTLPLTVLWHDLSEQDQAALFEHGMLLEKVEPIQNPYTGNATKNLARFANTYTKLRAFALTQFEKIVFLDADVIVLQGIDDLFEFERFAAAPDHGKALNPERFNTGVFVVKPDKDRFEDMLAKVPVTISPDNSDQGFLNAYYGDNWVKLSFRYNTLKRMYEHHPKLFDLERTKVLHFVGAKPWQQAPKRESAKYATLNRLWQDMYAL